MAQGLNKVLLIGNLGADPDLRFMQNGEPMLKLRLATTESFGKRNGERGERTEWHTVVLWGKRGEALSKLLAKGRSIFVEGRLQTREWEDKSGGKRWSTEVVATDVKLLGGDRRVGGAIDPGSGPSSSGGGASDDSDIPF